MSIPRPDPALVRRINAEYLAGARYDELAHKYGRSVRTLKYWFTWCELPCKRDVRKYRSSGMKKVRDSDYRVSKNGPYGLYIHAILQV